MKPDKTLSGTIAPLKQVLYTTGKHVPFENLTVGAQN